VARFSDEFIEQVLDRNDIVEVISQYVPLRAKGRNYWGCCPFHGEKTPSFSVSPEKRFYYCFGCHAGGTVIRFVQEMDKLEFGEAVEKLAERAGLELPQGQEASRGPSRSRQQAAWDACRAAARWYHETLFKPEGKPGLDYLTRRGLPLAMIRRFGLGFAADGWQNLQTALEAQGISKEAMLDARLILEKDHRTYDAFRNRVMFPILDHRGRVLGFGGRVMDKSEPKYLNSPDTIIYNKRKNLYAINLMKKLENRDKLILTEGYMDVIALHQAGFPMAVASLGTALTPEQAHLMKRYVDRVYLMYDGDSAGQQATIRGMDILAKEGLQVQVVSLPDGLDPDDMARKRGHDDIQECLDKALNLTDYKLMVLRRNVDMTNAQARRHYAIEVCHRVIAKMDSPVEQGDYIRRLHMDTGISEVDLRNEIVRQGGEEDAGDRTQRAWTGDARVPEYATDNAEEMLLCMLLTDSAKAANAAMELEDEDFSTGAMRLAVAWLLSLSGEDPAAHLQEIPPDAEPLILKAMALPKVTAGNHALVDCVKRIRYAALSRRTDGITAALKNADEEERIRLKQQLQQILNKQNALKP